MDCKTARLLLDYARPNGRELDAVEARALEDHLVACADCDLQAHNERRADEVVGRAMRQVDVPDRLRARILARLNEERGERRRRWIVYSVRTSAAAAAVLLLVLGLWRWYATRLPAFPAQSLLTDVNNRVIAPPSRQQVAETLKSRGVETAAPDLNYSYLRWMFLTNVEGRQTPMLIFNNSVPDGDRSRQSQHALVFIVSDNQFDVNALPPNPQADNAYEYKCAIRHGHGEPYGCVIYYTGENVAWLDPPLPTPPVVGQGD